MKRLVFIVGLFYVSNGYQAFAKDDKDLPTQSYKDRLYWGNCQLNYDPQLTEDSAKMWPAACVKPTISSSVLIRGNKDQKYILHYSDLYAGLHINRFLSMHGEWQRFRLVDENGEIGTKTTRDESVTKKAFLQIGNNSIANLRVATGQMPIPFGIDRVVLQEIFSQVVKNQKYWRSPKWVGKLTVDNLVSSQYDIAYATDNIDPKNKKRTDEDDKDRTLRAFSARMMFDIGALSGFRLVFSGYGENHGQRRMGFGFFTVSENEDSTAFEWVRLITTPDGKEEPFDQLFRLNYLSGYQKNVRWAVEYEDDRFGYRIFTFGPDFKIKHYGSWRIGIAYLDTIDVNEKNFFMFSTGLQVGF